MQYSGTVVMQYISTPPHYSVPWRNLTTPDKQMFEASRFLQGLLTWYLAIEPYCGMCGMQAGNVFPEAALCLQFNRTW